MRLGILAVGAAAALGACTTTHLLGPADEAAIRSSTHLDALAYRGLDAGKERAEIRAAYCDDQSVLQRSGIDAGDEGIACPKVGQ